MTTGWMLKRLARLVACVSLVLAVASVADARPEAPVILVHGLYGGGDAWREFGDHLRGNGWKFGGKPRVDAKTKQVTGLSGSGDYYLIEFSDSKSLRFEQQASELGLVIKAVLKVNRASKVLLVGHSMGGLAARQYLQFHSAADEVGVLVTVGTPHGGADIAPFVDSLFGLGARSVGVQELMPDSTAMLKLNGQVKRLPRAVKYTSIIGTGTAEMSGGQDGDGIVTASSQNLANLAGTGDLKHEKKEVFIQRRFPCSDSRIAESHRCETTDRGVWSAILGGLREDIAKEQDSRTAQAKSLEKPSGIPAASTASPEFTFRMKDGSTVSGQLKEESIKVKSSVGTATVPVKDIASFSEGQLRLKDGNVLKGELAASSLAVTSKYGTLQLSVKDVVWLGVGKPPDPAVASPAAPRPPEVSAAKPPAAPAPPPAAKVDLSTSEPPALVERWIAAYRGGNIRAHKSVDLVFARGMMDVQQNTPQRDWVKKHDEAVQNSEKHHPSWIKLLADLRGEYCNLQHRRVLNVQWDYLNTELDRYHPLADAMILDADVKYQILESRRDGKRNGEYHRLFVEFQPGNPSAFRCNNRPVRKMVVTFWVTDEVTRTVSGKKQMMVMLGGFGLESPDRLSQKYLDVDAEFLPMESTGGQSGPPSDMSAVARQPSVPRSGPMASLPPASSQAGQSTQVRFVNESGGPVRLQITGNSKIDVGGKRWVTIHPGKSDEIPVMTGQQKLRVEQVKTAGFLVTGAGARFEKTVEIAPDTPLRITNEDFK